MPKAGSRAQLGKTVAVIASRADLLSAKQMRLAVDFFELRLDAVASIVDQVDRAMQSLKSPVIITARHPREGGANNLSAIQRAKLVLRFLGRAAYIDIESRALRELRHVRQQARAGKVGLIISVHDFKGTPRLSSLRRKAYAAAQAGADIFKVATRTDTSEQLDRLLTFFDAQDVDLPISAMGFGKFGRVARLELAARGSALNYVHLGKAQFPGQFSFLEWNKIMGHLHR
jgi:3-dehydroquinate dehydratase-1